MKSQDTINALNEEHFRDIKSTLSEILEQTKKTNGRVTSLENWKAWATGVTIALWVVAVPLVIYIFNSEIQNVRAEIK